LEKLSEKAEKIREMKKITEEALQGGYPMNCGASPSRALHSPISGARRTHKEEGNGVWKFSCFFLV
jgi:hypothetical protein